MDPSNPLQSRGPRSVYDTGPKLDTPLDCMREMVGDLKETVRLSDLIHKCLLISTMIVAGAAIIYLGFILIPLTMAYFVTFLLAPLMDAMEARPLHCGRCTFCDPDQRLGGLLRRDHVTCLGARDGGGLWRQLAEFVLLGKVPHALSLVITGGCLVGFVSGVVLLVYSSANEFLANSGDMATELAEMEQALYSGLGEMGVQLKSSNETGNVTYDSYFGGSSMEEAGGLAVDELVKLVGNVTFALLDVVNVLLLSIYLMIGRKPGRTFGGSGPLIEDIEDMVKHYISLKALISVVTGLLVAIILKALGVQLAAVIGLLSFILNFIPTVGSLIASFLPLPVALLDKNLGATTKLLAFAGPASVQLYVGNVLEPQLFGASLNLTPLSVLLALVFWGLVWGLSGAVLSVPLLGVARVCLSHTNHPYGRALLSMIRDKDDVNEKEERLKQTVARASLAVTGIGPLRNTFRASTVGLDTTGMRRTSSLSGQAYGKVSVGPGSGGKLPGGHRAMSGQTMDRGGETLFARGQRLSRGDSVSSGDTELQPLNEDEDHADDDDDGGGDLR